MEDKNRSNQYVKSSDVNLEIYKKRRINQREEMIFVIKSKSNLGMLLILQV